MLLAVGIAWRPVRRLPRVPRHVFLSARRLQVERAFVRCWIRQECCATFVPTDGRLGCSFAPPQPSGCSARLKVAARVERGAATRAPHSPMGHRFTDGAGHARPSDPNDSSLRAPPAKSASHGVHSPYDLGGCCYRARRIRTCRDPGAGRQSAAGPRRLRQPARSL